MLRTQPSQRIPACIATIVVLILSAQFQSFLQHFKDELRTEVSAAASPDAHPSGSRQEFNGDFKVYYTASLVARRPGDHRLYYLPENAHLFWTEDVPQDTPWARIARSAGFTSTMHFNYPPFAALLLVPLSLFKWQISLLIWRVVLTGLVLVSIYLCTLLTGSEHLWLKFGLATAAAFSFFPLAETLSEGQLDPVILLCWVGGIFLIKTDRPFCSGLLFALGTAVKLTPALAVGLFLLRRQWKWLLSYAGWLVGLQALSIWRLGWDNHASFAKQVLPALSCGIANLGNKSIGGFVYDVYLRQVPLGMGPSMPGWLCLVIKLIGLSLYAGVLFHFWRRNRTSSILVEELLTVSLVTLLVAPVSWRHHYLLSLIPLLYLWNIAQKQFDIAVLAMATIGIGTVFPDYVIATIRNPILDIALASIVPMSGLLLLWVLCRCTNTMPNFTDNASLRYSRHAT